MLILETKMPDPRTVQARIAEMAAKKAERDNASSVENGAQIALNQIADALIALQADIQDIRIAVEAMARK
jgi:hypothetical protein